MRLPRRQEGGGRGRRWKEEARGGPSRRKKTLVRVFNLLVYTRITPPYHRAVSPPLPLSLSSPVPLPPSTSSLLRYVAPVIGDVSAFLRNSLDKGGRARGLYTGGWSNCLVWTICWGGKELGGYISEIRLKLFPFFFLFYFWYISIEDNNTINEWEN